MDGAIPFVSSTGVRPLSEAVTYRVFKAIARIIAPESFSAMSALLGIEEILGPMFDCDYEPMETWEWLRSIGTSRRRKILVKAWKEFLERNGPHPDWEDIKPFVKSELLPLFKGMLYGPDREMCSYVCRLIQAPHDDTHIIAGPYLKPLLGGYGYKGLKGTWHEDNWIFYAATGPEKLDKWLRRTQSAVSWFWSDYSAFDATYSKEAWSVLEGVYRRCYPNADPLFWKVLDIWRKPHGKIRLRKEEVTLEYWAEVCNASGRDDTALANAMLNGLVLSLSFSAALSGVAIKDLQRSHVQKAMELVDIAIVGDDSLVACKFDIELYREAVETNIRSFGLDATVCTSPNLCDVTFLGMMPYPVAGQLYWGPTIGRRMYKAFWQRDPVGNLAAWTRGVAQQLMLFANVPILREMAERVEILLRGHKVTRVQHDEHRPWTSITEANPKWDITTIDWLCRRYPNLTPAIIQGDLDNIGRVERLPAVLHLESLEIILSQDDL